MHDPLVDARFAHEKRLTVLARHGQSVRRRWAFGVLGLALAAASARFDVFTTPWWQAAVPTSVLLAANAWCAWRIRRDRVRVRQFWGMLAADAVTIAALCAMGGEHGELAIGFYLVIAAAYGLGLPRAARTHLALSSLLYPAARWSAGATTPTVVVETASMLALGYLAIASPMRFTYRLRRARRALGALERGDFSPRLPTRAMDDLGFLAESVNRTAEALGCAVDELRRSREALAHQAYHDPLTGLANRARFDERLERALAGPRAADVAILMVDLDDFKLVNDRLGHAAGDRVLVAVAERLLDATRGCDTVARLGGDEFTVLLENVGTTADAEVAARRIVQSLAAPFDVDGVAARVGASVGIARPGPGVADAPSMLRRADAAMYHVKARGKGGFTLGDAAA